jgi:thiamine-phosphate pyrophosphorylase
VILCYITDRSQFLGDTDRLRAKISEAMAAGVDYIQLREKNLSARELEEFALRTVNREPGTSRASTRLLFNSRVDVAWACRAHGVHLPANEISPADVRRIWRGNNHPVIGVSCHSATEVTRASEEGADFVVFGPVFEKGNARPHGLGGLRKACQSPIPVLALGGVTLANAKSCMEEGAAGIAAIRLFQENNVADVVAALRRLQA